MSRQEDVQTVVAFQIAFVWSADVSLEWKWGFLAVELPGPMPAGACVTQRWHQGAQTTPRFRSFLPLLSFFAHWPLGFASSPNLSVHYTTLP